MQNRSLPTIVAAGPRIAFPQLVDAVRTLGPHPLDIMLSILDTARVEMGLMDVSYTEREKTFHAWQVGAAVLAGAATIDAPVALPQEYVRLPPEERVALLIRAGGLSTASRVAQGRDGSPEERLRTILSTLCTRSSLQRDFKYQIALTLHVLGACDLSTGTLREASAVDALFRAAYSCTLLEYVQIMIATWTLARHSCALKPGTWFGRAAEPERLRGAAISILRGQSVAPSDIVASLSAEFAAYGGDGLVQAWYAQYPFFAAKDDHFIAAPPPFIRLAASAGAFFRALALARANAEDAGSSRPWTNDHSSEMGRRFETFTSVLLNEARSGEGERIWGEYAYLKTQNALSPDFIVANQARPREVLVIQAKLKRLQPGAFYGYDPAQLQEDAEGPLSELIWKSIRYLYAIETTQPNRLDPTHKDLHDLIRSADSILLLGMVPTMPSLFQFDDFRAPVLMGMREKLRPEEWDWFERNSPRFLPWHIIDAEEIATFISARREGATRDETLHNALRSYLCEPGFGKLATPEGILLPFRDWYIRHRTSGNVPSSVATIDRIFNALFTSSMELFFPGESMTEEAL